MRVLAINNEKPVGPGSALNIMVVTAFNLFALRLRTSKFSISHTRKIKPLAHLLGGLHFFEYSLNLGSREFISTYLKNSNASRERHTVANSDLHQQHDQLRFV